MEKERGRGKGKIKKIKKKTCYLFAV